MTQTFPRKPLLLAPMEGLLDFVLRDVLTRVGGVDRCVAGFIRVSGKLLTEGYMALMREQKRQNALLSVLAILVAGLLVLVLNR